MIFCNMYKEDEQIIINFVTILILIDGFLQYDVELSDKAKEESHNPYFNRWFSAISLRGYQVVQVARSQSLF